MNFDLIHMVGLNRQHGTMCERADRAAAVAGTWAAIKNDADEISGNRHERLTNRRINGETQRSWRTCGGKKNIADR